MIVVHSPALLRSIIRDVKKSMSYSLVAQRHGLTRCQVAGIVWRHKNPYSTRVNSPNGIGNKCGRGRHGGGAWPEKHLWNTP